MFEVGSNSVRGGKFVVLVLLLSVVVASPFAAYGKKKKAAETAVQSETTAPLHYDYSRLVWPNPPAIARVRYVEYLAGMKIDYSVDNKKKQKAGWMDRLAGTPEGSEKQEKMMKTFPYQMIGPYGIGIDSKGLVYVADQRVGAIFVFNTETRDAQLIKNGEGAHFSLINGIAIDDNDRLFVSDGKLRHVLVFNDKHVVEGQINEGMIDPNGIAIDTENRYLYVADTQQDQVLVYDADTFKLLRRIGTGGKKHTLTTPGDFGGPTNVAVDADGNVYVTDTINDRVEIFDAEGNFISMFGKNCDAPGCFQRPKGIAVDSDGHIWVADAMSDRLQVFNREGQLLTYIGSGHGHFPGQFYSMAGLAIDKNNRVYTSEQEPGRVQVFRYVTDAEAAAEKKRQEDERQKKADAARASKSADTPQVSTPAASGQQPASTPAQAGTPGAATKK